MGVVMFKVGDKVKVLSKTIVVWGGTSKPLDQGYGYVSIILGDGSGRNHYNCIVVDDVPGTNEGDFFALQDLQHFVESSKIDQSLFDFE